MSRRRRPAVTSCPAGRRRLALLLIQHAATVKPVLSVNDIRVDLDRRSIPDQVRSQAFKELIGEYIIPIGYEESTDPTVRGRSKRNPKTVRTYRSLIFTGEPESTAITGESS